MARTIVFGFACASALAAAFATPILLGLWLTASDTAHDATRRATIADPARHSSVHFKENRHRVRRTRKADRAPVNYGTRIAVIKPRMRAPRALTRSDRADITRLIETMRPNLTAPPRLARRPQAAPGAKTRLIAFASAPFPYTGSVPRTNKPFLNVEEDGRRGRRTFSGRLYWQDETYNDRRVLLHIPEGFDPKRRSVMVLFFHGHGATLERDVLKRQRVAEQITASGMNAVLVAPQFAVDARDSSAGNFWKPRGMRRFLKEVSKRLAGLSGDPQTRRIFARMPIVLVGYSGGYSPAAWVLANGALGKRVKGVVLLDGLYGHLGKYASWIERNRNAFFLSAYARSTKRRNLKFAQMLRDRNLPVTTALNAKLRPGSITIIEAQTRHRSYVTYAWAHYPISDVLGRMTGVEPRSNPALSAALSPASGFARLSARAR